MIAILRPLFALLFAVSLLCGGAAMAHGVSIDAVHGAQAMEDHHGWSGQDCDECEAPDAVAGAACVALAVHCAPALASIDGGEMIERLGLPLDRIHPADLTLIGSGPDFDTPPPRA